MNGITAICNNGAEGRLNSGKYSNFRELERKILLMKIRVIAGTRELRAVKMLKLEIT